MGAPQELKKKVQAKVDALQEEAVRLFQDIVRIPSFNPPGNEKKVADYCADYMRRLGMEVDQIEPFPLRVSNRGRLRGTEGKPTLLFNSHLDTIHPGDERNWIHPPFSGEIHDGHVWGIGANNMKCGVAAALFTVKALQACGVKLRGDILLTETADELQFGFKGIKVMVDQGMIQADFGVYTESDRLIHVEETHSPAMTGKLDDDSSVKRERQLRPIETHMVAIGHRGIVIFDVTVYGLGSHVSRPEKGINAIYKGLKLVDRLRRMKFTNWKPHHIVPGAPILAVNRFNAGHSNTICPDKAVIRCDCRTIPGQTTQHVLADVQRLIDELKAEDPNFEADISVYLEGESSWHEPDEPIVKEIQRAYQEVMGKPLAAGGVPSTSDARFLRNNCGIPTGKFCIKSFDSGPNEHEKIEDYIHTIKTYCVLCLNLLY